MLGSPRMLLWMSLGTAVVAAAVLVLITGEWWTLLIPVGLHALATILIVGGVFKVIDEERDKPDPVAQAKLDEEGKRSATP